MNRNLTPIFVGAAAGLAAALLSVGSVAQTGLSFALFVLSPLPIMIAALGWGPVAGFASVAVCGLTIWQFAGLSPALIIAATTAVPSAIATYLAGMARHGGGRAEWYPLSSILLALTLCVAAGFVFVGYLIGFNEEYARTLGVEMVKTLAEADPQFALNPGSTMTLANLIVKAIPFLQPASWTLVLISNFWAALHIARRSGLLQRPKDDFPTSFSMPWLALPLFTLAVAGSFLAGGFGLIASCFAGALAMAFTIAGFAKFHAVTRGKSWRAVALSMGYFTVLTIGFPALFFLFAGLFSASRNTAKSG